jgi:hypothetical protein
MSRIMSNAAVLCLASVLMAACGSSNRAVDQAPRYAATITSSAPLAATDYYDVMQRIYVAYFGRPADPAGLAYWAEQYRAAGLPNKLADLANAYDKNPNAKTLIDVFGASQESKDLYPGDNDAFVTAIYHNIFSHEPDAAGKAWWVGLIDHGVMTRPIAALLIMSGSQGSDVTVIDHKIGVAAMFTAALNGDARKGAYDGLTANAKVRAVMALVNDGTAVAPFQAQINAIVAVLMQDKAPAPLAPSAVGGPVPPTCDASNFTEAKLNALGAGLNYAQALGVIGCGPKRDSESNGNKIYVWESGSSFSSQRITMYFDDITGRTTMDVMSANIGRWPSVLSNACSASNFSSSIPSLIKPGMTFDDVTRVFGCAPATLAVHSNFDRRGFTAYSWTSAADASLPALVQSHNFQVIFDSSTKVYENVQYIGFLGLSSDASYPPMTMMPIPLAASVTVDGNGDPSLTKCDESNFTVAKLNALGHGMSFEEAAKVIGCKYDVLSTSSTGRQYRWSSPVNTSKPTGSSFYYMGFDASTGRSTEDSLSSWNVDRWLSPIENLQCGSTNFSAATFASLKAGMSYAEVTKAIGCTAGNVMLQSDFETRQAPAYQWAWVDPLNAGRISMFMVSFDPVTKLSTTIINGGSIALH